MSAETVKTARRSDHQGGRYLPLFMIALVSAFFALLFSTMAMVDLGRFERLLVSFLERRGASVVELLARDSGTNYRLLMRQDTEPVGLDPTAADDEEVLALQELLVSGLVDVARHVEFLDRAGSLSREMLDSLSTSDDIQDIVVFGETGELLFSRQPVPSKLLVRVKGLREGREQFVLHLFDDSSPQDGGGFIGVGRWDGKGSVLLVLNAECLQTWAWKAAVTQAVDDRRWGEEVAYMVVKNNSGRLVAQSGDVPLEDTGTAHVAANGLPTGGVLRSRFLEDGDRKIVELLSPLEVEGRAIGLARVGLEVGEANRLVAENRRHILLWTAGTILIGLVAMGLLYRIQNRHTSKLQAMTERLHQAERLSSLGKLGAGMAHEIRNPLNAISMAAQRLQREFPTVEENKAACNRIIEVIRLETRRLNLLVEDFLSLSRSGRLHLRHHSLLEVLQRVVFLVQPQAQANGVRIETRWDEAPFEMLIDPDRMEQALLNLIRNAMEASPKDGLIVVSMGPDEKDRVRISVTDNGAGIAPSELGRVFDPYYTTKEKGVGLGLSIVHEIVRAHGGHIRVSSEPSRGTTFEILLPRQVSGK